MASNRFLMVPEDSSAARMPLPGMTMALAIVLRSARFIRFLRRSFLELRNRRFSGKAQESGEGPLDIADFVVADASDYRTSLDAAQSSKLVNHDLGKMAQTIVGSWRYR